MNNPIPRFTGIFIPIEILELKSINHLEKILLSWIDALYCKEKGGCFASNDYLAARLNVETNSIAKILTKFRKLNLIEDVSFDGRTRVMRSLMNVYVEECQKNPVLDINPIATKPSSIGRPSNPTLDIHPSYPIVESKEESKESGKRKATHSTTPSSSKKKKQKQVAKKLPFGTYVELKEGEYQDLCSSFGQQLVDSTIIKINDWVPNNHTYKDYAAAIRTWVRKEKEFVKNDSKAHPEASSNNSVPNDLDSIIDQKKAFSERIKGIVSPYCNEKTFFTVTHTEVTVRCKIKDINNTYQFGVTDARFKEKLLQDVQIAFPQVRDQILGNGQSATRFAQDLVNKFKRAE